MSKIEGSFEVNVDSPIVDLDRNVGKFGIFRSVYLAHSDSRTARKICKNVNATEGFYCPVARRTDLSVISYVANNADCTSLAFCIYLCYLFVKHLFVHVAHYDVTAERGDILREQKSHTRCRACRKRDLTFKFSHFFILSFM